LRGKKLEMAFEYDLNMVWGQLSKISEDNKNYFCKKKFKWTPDIWHKNYRQDNQNEIDVFCELLQGKN
jgi:hypothetical protein